MIRTSGLTVIQIQRGYERTIDSRLKLNEEIYKTWSIKKYCQVISNFRFKKCLPEL